jgi:hypothetical protein
MDEDLDDLPPSTYAWLWLRGVLRYGTPRESDDQAWSVWAITHATLRGIAAREVLGSASDATIAELTDVAAVRDDELWDMFAPRMMAYFRGLFPAELGGEPGFFVADDGRNGERQAVTFSTSGDPAYAFYLTVEAHPHGWQVIGLEVGPYPSPERTE